MEKCLSWLKKELTDDGEKNKRPFLGDGSATAVSCSQYFPATYSIVDTGFYFVAVISKSRMLTHSRMRKGFRGCSAGIAGY